MWFTNNIMPFFRLEQGGLKPTWLEKDDEIIHVDI